VYADGDGIYFGALMVMLPLRCAFHRRTVHLRIFFGGFAETETGGARSEKPICRMLNKIPKVKHQQSRPR
jgi:hypothetical protein